MDLMTFLIGIIVVGVLIQAGYTSIAQLITPPVEESVKTSPEILSTTTPYSNYDESLPPSNQY